MMTVLATVETRRVMLWIHLCIELTLTPHPPSHPLTLTLMIVDRQMNNC